MPFPNSSDVAGGDTAQATQYNNLRADVLDLEDRKVENTGDESIAGVKTFTSIPVLPASDPTTDNQATRKKFVSDHIASTAAGIHGSTTAATANRLVHRDASGRAKVAAPSASDDIARKNEVDTHANTQTAGVHGSTTAATANKLVHRDASGRSQVAEPSAAADIATKNYVDAKTIAVLTAGATINGATTPVPVYQNPANGLILTCDANTAGSQRFIGFAISNGTNGNPITVQFSGVVGGFSGLTVGEKYYLSNTLGAITTTPSTTLEVLVGMAISATQLFIQKGSRVKAGTITLGTNPGSKVITLGFKPKKITLHARSTEPQSTTRVCLLDLVWINGDISSVTLFGSTTNSFVETGESNLYDAANASDWLNLSIGSVTASAFTLTWTETSGVSGDLAVLWIAEGEI